MNALNLISAITIILGLQINDNLIELLNGTNALLSDIETDKEIIYQQVSFDEALPFNIEFIKTVEKIKDGKQKTESYLLNLALVNDRKIEIKSSKSKMLIRLETTGGKYIQKFEEGEPKGFVNNIEIQSSDIDVAREIKDILDKAVPVAKDTWESAIEVPSDLEPLKEWLSKYITDVSGGKKSWSQSLKSHEMYKDYGIVGVQESDKEASTYQFSWADIEPKSLKVSPTGDLIEMELKTKSNKRFLTLDNEKGMSFENKITLYFDEAASALELTKGIEKAIEYSLPVAKARLDSYAECTSCIDQLSTSVSGYSGKSWSTTMNSECDATLSYQRVGKEDEETFNFYWSDMNVKSLKQDYNSSEMKLTLETNKKQKFVTKMSDGQVKGYDSEIELLFNDTEAFRKAKFQVEKIIGSCVLDLQPESIEWINGTFTSAAINQMEQTISYEADDDCSVVYNSSKVDSDKNDAFEFNLYDIDSKRLNLKISGSKLQLELNTNKNEKIITKTNQDGKLEYANKVVMDFDNITSLRVGKMTLEKAIIGCSE